MIQGIAPTPRIELKMKPQEKDPIYGNYFIHHYLGQSSDPRHRQFRAFFSVQDPLITTPPSKYCSKFKLEPFLKCIQYIYLETLITGKNISRYEQTFWFKEKYSDKLRINFKKAGYIFQAYALFDDGYTLCFSFHNHPPPQKYVSEGLSPLHCHMFALFEWLEENWH